MAEIDKILYQSFKEPRSLSRDDLLKCYSFLEDLNLKMNQYTDACFETPNGNDIGKYLRRLEWYIEHSN